MARINLDIWNHIDWALLESIDWELVQTTAFVFFFEVTLLAILMGLRHRRLALPARPKRRSPFEVWTAARRESNAVLARAHTSVAFTTPKSIARFVPRAPRKKRFFPVGTSAREEAAVATRTIPEPWFEEASWTDLVPAKARKPTQRRLALPSSAPPIPFRGARAKTRLSSN